MKKALIMTFFVLTVAALCCLSIHCSRGTAPMESSPLGVIGVWSWVKTTGGFPYQEIRADSVGLTQHVVFTAQKSVQYWYDYERVLDGGYSLSYEAFWEDRTDTILVVHYEGINMEPHAAEFIGGDTLILTEKDQHGCSFTYVRID